MQAVAAVFVIVIHRIHDRDRFQAAVAEALAAGLPHGIALPWQAASRDHRLGIYVWEGESVTAVRDVVEDLLGSFADSEYYEMDVGGQGHRAASEIVSEPGAR